MKINKPQEDARIIVNSTEDLVDIMREGIEELFLPEQRSGTIIESEYIEDNTRELIEKIKIEPIEIFQNNPLLAPKKK